MKQLQQHSPPGLMVAHLQPEHARAFIHAKKESGEDVSTATKYHRRQHFAVIAKWAMESGHIHRNPLSEIKMANKGKRMPEFLTAEQFERVLRAIDAHVEMKKPGGHMRDGEVLWLKDFVRVAVGTGARLGEVASLRWNDVDFENGFVTVRNTESFETKSGHERSIPLVADALEVLRRRHAERTDDLDGPALTYGVGRPVVPGYASKRFKKFVRLARVPERIKFHSLRHTCASWLTMKGVSPAIIQQILGHADIATTMLYAHHAPDTMKSEMARALQN